MPTLFVRSLYIQGQSPEPKVREYFYFIDHQGMVRTFGFLREISECVSLYSMSEKVDRWMTQNLYQITSDYEMKYQNDICQNKYVLMPIFEKSSPLLCNIFPIFKSM